MNITHQAVLRRLCDKPHTHQESVPLRVLQGIMLDTGGSVMAGGLRFEIVFKKLCPGIFNLSLKGKQ